MRKLIVFAALTVFGGMMMQAEAAPRPDKPSPTPAPKVPVQRPQPTPADLAAISIGCSFAGDPTMGTAKFVTFGIYRNVGGTKSTAMRLARLQYKVGAGPWTTVATASASNMMPG